MKQYSTSDEMRPSRKTINMIKQIAYNLSRYQNEWTLRGVLPQLK